MGQLETCRGGTGERGVSWRLVEGALGREGWVSWRLVEGALGREGWNSWRLVEGRGQWGERGGSAGDL